MYSLWGEARLERVELLIEKNGRRVTEWAALQTCHHEGKQRNEAVARGAYEDWVILGGNGRYFNIEGED